MSEEKNTSFELVRAISVYAKAEDLIDGTPAFNNNVNGVVTLIDRDRDLDVVVIEYEQSMTLHDFKFGESIFVRSGGVADDLIDIIKSGRCLDFDSTASKLIACIINEAIPNANATIKDGRIIFKAVGFVDYDKFLDAKILADKKERASKLTIKSTNGIVYDYEIINSITTKRKTL